MSIARKIHAVYEIRHLTSGRRYIGGAVDFVNRRSVHRYRLRRNNHSDGDLQRLWNADGEGAFAFIILEIVEDPSRLLELEQRFLDLAFAQDDQPPLNMVRYAGAPRGFKHGAAMRAKLSSARKGRPQTEAHKAARSAALKGRRPSDATIAASVAYHTGRKHSEEMIAAKSAALKAAWQQGKFAGRRKSAASCTPA